MREGVVIGQTYVRLDFRKKPLRRLQIVALGDPPVCVITFGPGKGERAFLPDDHRWKLEPQNKTPIHRYTKSLYESGELQE